MNITNLLPYAANKPGLDHKHGRGEERGVNKERQVLYISFIEEKKIVKTPKSKPTRNNQPVLSKTGTC
jgi:hypothetical protein